MTYQPVILLAEGGHTVTTGWRAGLFVAIMVIFLIGGVFMLLQSSFGPLQGALVTGTAFTGCMLALALLWLTGVPGIPLPGSIPDIPTSTPRFLGPQGSLDAFVFDRVVTADQASSEEFVEVDPENLTNPKLETEIASAETAANQTIGATYARELGVESAIVVADQSYAVQTVQILRGDGKVQRVRFTTGKAEKRDTMTEDQKALIDRIQPKTFEMRLVTGDLGVKTYIYLVAFALLFVLFVGLLTWYELAQVRQPTGVPESVGAPA